MGSNLQRKSYDFDIWPHIFYHFITFFNIMVSIPSNTILNDSLSEGKIYVKTKFSLLKCNFFIKHILKTYPKNNNNNNNNNKR